MVLPDDINNFLGFVSRNILTSPLQEYVKNEKRQYP